MNYVYSGDSLYSGSVDGTTSQQPQQGALPSGHAAVPAAEANSQMLTTRACPATVRRVRVILYVVYLTNLPSLLQLPAHHGKHRDSKFFQVYHSTEDRWSKIEVTPAGKCLVKLCGHVLCLLSCRFFFGFCFLNPSCSSKH